MVKHYSKLTQEQLDELLNTELAEYVIDTGAKHTIPHPILGDSGLSQRTVNSLEEKGVYTLRDLLGLDLEQLREVKNFGEKSEKVVFSVLRRLGFWRKT